MSEKPKRYHCPSCGWERPLGKEFKTSREAESDHSLWVMTFEMGCSLKPVIHPNNTQEDQP